MDNEERINELLETISLMEVPPFDEYDRDPDEIKGLLDTWYSITQSTLKLLFELKNDGKLDKNQLVVFNNAMDRFGWGEIKSKKDIKQNNLNLDLHKKINEEDLSSEDSFRSVYEMLYETRLAPESPYMRLCKLWDIENTVLKADNKRNIRIRKRIINDHKKRIENLDDEKKLEYLKLWIAKTHLLARSIDDLEDEMKMPVNESDDISELYKGNADDVVDLDEATSSIPTLKRRCDDVKYKSIRKHGKEFAESDEALLKEAMLIGYTAGLNANTTKMLIRKRDNNITGHNSNKN